MRFCKPYILLVLMISLLATGCALRHPKQTYHATKHPFLQPLDFKYLTLYTSITYSHGPISYPLRLQFRMQRDKLIWFSATTPWGIEIARGRISPTAVEVINHLEHTYTSYDYASLQAICQCPCNYALIQAILLGELPDGYSNRTITLQNDTTLIQQQKGFWQLEAMVKGDLGKIGTLSVIDRLTQDRLVVDYERFKSYPQGLLFRDATLYLGKFIFKMSHTQVRWSDKKLRFPFIIPLQYAKA